MREVHWRASWPAYAGELRADRLVDGKRSERHMVADAADGDAGCRVHLTLRAAAGAVAAIDAVLLATLKDGCSATMLPPIATKPS